MRQKVIKFILISLVATSAFGASYTVIKSDLDQDGLMDFTKIVHKMPVGPNVRRVLPEDGGLEGGNSRHDYVQIETGKHLIYVMNFPFVEKIESAIAVRDPDFRQCAKGKKGGIFANSEEGSVFIYYRNGKFFYKYCFE